MALPRSPWRRWRGALCFPNGGFGDFPPPPPIGSCLARPQSCPCSCHRARVAVLRCVRLAVGVCFALSTDSPRGRGRRGRRSRPKPSAAVRCQTSLPRICRARFSALRRASPPPLGHCPALRCEAGRKPREGGGRFCEVGTTPRTTNRRTGACFASRWLRLFPRQRDAARTLREHFAQGERIVLAP